MRHCSVCGCIEGTIGIGGRCELCQKLPWKEAVKLLQLRRIADALEDIERKTSDRNKW